MSGAFGASLHFAVHLLALTVALGAGIVVVGERGERRWARVFGGMGLLALAAGEALHGAGFAADAALVPSALRTAGFGLLFLYAVGPLPRDAGVPVALALPGRAIPAAAAALLAALVIAWRRRDTARRLLAAGLVTLAGAEILLSLRPAPTWAHDGYHWIRTGGFLLLAGFISLSTRRSLQFRMIAGFVGLLILVVMVISITVTQIVGRNLRQGALGRAESQALEAARGFQPGRLVANRVPSLLALGQVVREPVIRGRKVSDQFIERFRSRLASEIDFLVVIGRTGVVLGKTVRFREALEIVGTDLVTAAIDSGNETGGLELVSRRELALVIAAPVEGNRRRTIGFVVGGFRVDQSFLEGFTVPHLAVFQAKPSDPRALTTAGFPSGERRSDLIQPSVLEAAKDAFSFGEDSYESTVSVRGEQYFASFVPLRQPGGDIVGILMAAEPAELLAATERDVNRVIFLVTLGVVGLALIASVYSARRITRPILALTRAARRVQSGDLDAKAPVAGTEEVGNLARAFNQMTESVSAMTADLREAAAEQARLRGRLETVVNSMSDGLIAVGTDGRVVTYNQAAAEIVGRPRSEVTGKALSDVLTLLDAEREELEVDGALPAAETTFVRRPDGREVPVAISSGELVGGEGRPLGHVYVLRDMSREHEIERMKTEFLANVSHELRTPLTPIIGYSEILMRREIPKARAAEFATGILESARRLERIVAMLVDFSAMEGGRMAISTDATAVRPLVKEVVDEWRDRAPNHKITTRMSRQLPKARADVPLVRRTLDELLDNAVKYSPEGGKITVAVASQNSGKRSMLKFDVSDQGIGIEPEDLAGIFEDFRQVDASDTRTFGGLGLGLAFVKRIVEAHGGTINAESQPGQGATVSFTLPAADGERKGRRTAKR